MISESQQTNLDYQLKQGHIQKEISHIAFASTTSNLMITAISLSICAESVIYFYLLNKLLG